MSEDPPLKRPRLEQEVIYVEADDEEHSFNPSEDDGHGIGMDIGEYVQASYYDASMDAKPENPAFDIRFVEAKRILQDMIQKADLFLTKDRNEHLLRLHERLQRVAQFPKREKVRIALIGQPGAGKSSLVNSLFDCVDLAETGASGSACTNVAIEFTEPLPGQDADFAAEIQFHSRGLHSFVTDLVEDYRRLSLDDRKADYETDDEEEDNDAESDAVNKLHLKSQAEHAFRMLHGLLRTRSQFANKEMLSGFLLSEDRDHDGYMPEAIAGELVTILETLVQDHCGGSRGTTLTLSAATATRLNRALAPYTRTISTMDKVQMWPLVKLIRVGIKNRPLLEQIVIADLPGVNDDNKLRREATQEYLRGTDAVWIVSPIQRVISLENIRDTLTSFDHRMNGHVALVCTFAEEGITHKLVDDLRNKMTELELQALEGKLAEEASAHAHLSEQRRMSALLTDPSMRMQFKPSLHYAEVEYRKAKFTLRLTLMRLRLLHVRQNMHELFPALKIIGVSNSFYNKLRLEPPSKNHHRLTVKDTGIDELRIFSQQLPGERSWIAMRAFFRDQVKDFRDHVAILLSSSAGQGKQDLKDRISVPIEQIHSSINEYYDSLVLHFECKISQHVMSKKQKHASSALLASKVWMQRPFTHHLYQKFAQNRGEFGARNIEHQSWNKQIADSIKKDLVGKWITLKNEQEDKRDQFMSTLSARLHNSMSSGKSEDGKPACMTQFEEMIARQSEALRTVVRDDHEELRGAVEAIRWQVQGVGTDSFIAKHLEDTYRSISRESGKGMKNRMHAVMNRELSAVYLSFVDAVAEGALDAFKSRCKQQCTNMHTNVDNIIAKLKDNFDTMLEDLPTDEQLTVYLELLSTFNDKIVRPRIDKVDNLLKQLQRQYSTQSE